MYHLFSIINKNIRNVLWCFWKVELAHGGRGNSSSTDRYSSQSGGRRGISKHTEYRGKCWILRASMKL